MRNSIDHSLQQALALTVILIRIGVTGRVFRQVKTSSLACSPAHSLVCITDEDSEIGGKGLVRRYDEGILSSSIKILCDAVIP
jgi:hypothetical protein